ncbi:MAG: dNTP triphosphohydrolase, partial [Cyclobacteriaceae bacterium]|nr:dNTP triphosphohydrolase [Cyclobacteriaceae bacterium]
KKDYNPHDFGAIVAAASLTHDIGNPPFGHSGEEAISDFFKFHDLGKEIHKIVDEVQWLDLTNFEGNAQGFRILNSPLYQGLSLTFATLAAFSKYPRPSHADKENGRKSHKKFGYFQSEKAIFRSLAEELELLPAAVGMDSWSRHPLTFLVEAADDICYGIIDLEDGCRLGLLSYKETEELLSPIIGAKFDPRKLEKYKNKEERIGLLRAMAIGQLIEECTEAFLGHEKALLTADFDKALTNVIPSNVFLEEIAKVSLERIYRAPKVVETETVGYEVLPGLLEVIVGAVFQKFNDPSKLSGRQKSIMRLIPEFHVLDIEQNKGNLYLQMLACTDFVSNMTDSAALSFYRKIKGIDLPKG